MENKYEATQFVCNKCGKKYSKVGIKMHQKWCKGSIDSKSNMVEVSDRVKNESINESKLSQFDSIESEEGIDMQEQFNKNKGQIEPIKESNEYQCEGCNATFNKPYKHCPECGANLTWD